MSSVGFVLSGAPYYLRAAVHAALGDMDAAVQLLQQTVDTREAIVFAFRQKPEMSPLLKDPRALKIYEQADAIRKTSTQRPRARRTAPTARPDVWRAIHAAQMTQLRSGSASRVGTI